MLQYLQPETLQVKYFSYYEIFWNIFNLGESSVGSTALVLRMREELWCRIWSTDLGEY